MCSRDRDSDGGISVLLDGSVADTADRPSGPPPAATGDTLDFAPIIPALREREDELARIDGLVADARAGEGRLLYIEGPAGIGKTALLAAARVRASAAGLVPLPARGAEVEREFPYGVVRQLFEPALAALAARERDEVLGGAAALAATVLTRPATPDVARDDFATPHGLYWTCANLAARRPLALLVDDAHWADEPSLRFLEFLERRMAGLAVLLVTVMRPGEEAGARLAATPGAIVIRPAPLSRAAVTDLVGVGLGPPEPEFAEACRRATGGNPFLLQELLRSLAEAGVAPTAAQAQRAQAAGPDALGRNLLGRLERLGDQAAALARGLAVMGDGAELRDAAAVAELDAAAATGAAAALAAAGLVADGRPLRFVHPIVRAAIYEATPAGARAAAHGRTVAVLAQAGAPPERLAAHLLQTEPGTDPATVATLREAARRAIAQGAPDAAIAALERALRERLADDDRVELLATLGRAESGAHHAGASAHLREAHRLATEPRRRAEIVHELVLAADPERTLETVRLVDDALAALGADDALAARLRADRLALVLGLPSLDAADAAWVESIAPPTAVVTPADSLTLVMLARHRIMRGRPVEDVVPLVELAVADWRVVEELAREELWLVHAAVILVTADRLDAAQALLARLLETARRRGVVRLFTLASTFSSFVALYSGDVPAAEADARTVLAVEGIERWRRAEAHAPLVEALVELGRADEAEAALETAGMAGPLPEARAFTPLLLARGRLRVAAGRHEEGLDDLKRAERRLDRSGRLHPAGLDGRASAVLALLALGRRDEARAAAREALERSHRWGTPRVVGRARRMEALAEGGPETVPRLEAAVAELERSPARLELAAALVDLGAAKRRANRRADARAPLKRALALADECGAVRIAEAARAELAATGIRVGRRDRSGPDALTPSERRICAMAAEGRSNPEIAQALFVTVKTVEMHLGHAYRKLDIRARGELAAVLRNAPN